jgi:methylamine--corrinoid protein Co-methyltransferase
MVEQMPIFGGYAGGLEETTIVDVATHINSFVMAHGSWHLDGPVHVRWGITTAREALAVAAHACRAVDANTNLMLGNQYYTLAGPCTEMCLMEVAAQAITDTISGREIVSGVAAAKGVKTNFHTGLEARMLAEACHAAAGIDLKKGNVILDKLVGLYEGNYKDPPKGKPFQECYDVVRVEPSDEYLAIYDKVCGTLAGLGLDYFKK